MGRTGIAAEPMIDGICASGFEAVADAFRENFRSRGEVGGVVAVMRDGAMVVDLWGGHADAARTRPWEADTLVCMMSVAKAATALCAHILVDRGALDMGAPVSRYWPAFAAAGKETIPVRYLLDHRAGLPAIEAPLPEGAAYDWDLMTGSLAAQAPLWPPGERRAYHSVTMGYLVGEVVRRISDKSLGRFLREEVCGPLEADYWIGLPESEHGRCAEFFGETRGTLFDRSDPSSLLRRAMAQVSPAEVNGPEFRSAEIPSINGFGTGRGVARLFGCLALGGGLDGVRVIGPEALDQGTTLQWTGKEELIGHERRMALGFLLGYPGHVALGPSPRAFGHTGAGGAVGFADPDTGIGFAYAPNHMYSGPGISPRLRALVDALYDAIA